MSIYGGFLFMETKFVSLKSLKVEDAGSGTISGYRSVFNVIDEGGDIVLPGAFKDCIPEYLDSGFTAHSHDWAFKEVVGFPIESYEDDHGWFVKSQFHSTPDAQAIRTKAKERMDAGKQVGFSFGYAPTEFSHVEAKDYEKELPKYVKADALTAMMEKAQKFNRIRILKKVDAIEDSLVTAPMNKRAAATAVKGREIHIQLHESPLTLELVEGEETKTIRKCREEDAEPGKPWCLYSSDGSKLLGRHATREEYVAQEQAIEANKSDLLKGITETESFESFESAESAIKKFIAKMRSNHEVRVKEGRVLSSSNRGMAQTWRDALAGLIDELDKLLAATEPKPKEKSIDVIALRAQSDRIRNRVMRDFS